MRALLSILGLAFLFLGWNAPNHYPPWPAFHLELCAGLGLCAIAASLALGQPGVAGSAPRGLPLGTAARVALVAACWPLLQHLLGQVPYRGDALLGFLYGAGVALSLCCGQLWALQQGRDRVLNLLHGCIVTGSIAACGLALVQWLRLSPPGWWAMELIDDRPFANFAQPNHLGLLMVWGIVSATALFESRVIERRGVWALAVVFLGAGALMSQSRASSLALAAVALLWALTRGRTASRLRPADVAPGVLAGIAMAAAIGPLQDLLLLSGPALRATAEVGPRELIWKHFLAAIVHQPWWGYGWNQGVAAMAAVAAEVEPSRNVTFAHNLGLDLMTWFGVPLALLALGGLATWMLGWLKRDEDPSLQSQRHLVFAIWLVLLVQSMLEFPFAHGYFLVPAALLAGAVAPQPASGAATGSATRWRYGAPAALLAAGCAVLLALTTRDYLRLEADFRQLRFDRAAFAGNVPLQPSGHALLLDQLAALNVAATRIPKKGMTAAELDEMRRLARRFHIPSVRLDYAKALALNGRGAEAEAELVVIRSVNPPLKWIQIEREWRQWLDAAAPALR